MSNLKFKKRKVETKMKYDNFGVEFELTMSASIIEYLKSRVQKNQSIILENAGAFMDIKKIAKGQKIDETLILDEMLKNKDFLQFAENLNLSEHQEDLLDIIPIFQENENKEDLINHFKESYSDLSDIFFQDFLNDLGDKIENFMGAIDTP